MTFKLISKILTPIALLAVMAAAQTFNETTFTTPIQNIRNILEAIGGGLVGVTILWSLYKFILGDRDSLKRAGAIVAVGICIFLLGPALEFVTGNAAFNQ